MYRVGAPRIDASPKTKRTKTENGKNAAGQDRTTKHTFPNLRLRRGLGIRSFADSRPLTGGRRRTQNTTGPVQQRVAEKLRTPTIDLQHSVTASQHSHTYQSTGEYPPTALHCIAKHFRKHTRHFFGTLYLVKNEETRENSRLTLDSSISAIYIQIDTLRDTASLKHSFHPPHSDIVHR